MSEVLIQKKYFLSAALLCTVFWISDAILDTALWHGTPRQLLMRCTSAILMGCVVVALGWCERESRRRARAVKQSDELSRVLFESARDAICLIDSRGLKV